MVSVRLASDATGPTFTHAHFVRHPRYKGNSGYWLAADLQTRGEHTKDDIMYIMLTRAVKGCTLWLHTLERS